MVKTNLSQTLNLAANRAFHWFLLVFIGAYRTIGTTHLGGSCRFEPSCSAYALEATRLHPPYTAVRLVASRIARCRPGGSYGFDPVPLPPSAINAPAAVSLSLKEMT